MPLAYSISCSNRRSDVAPGTTRAALASLTITIERLRLVQRQLADTKGQIDRIAGTLAAETDDAGGEPDGRRDAAILMSLPGVGRMVLSRAAVRS